jgi:hypothetical protein
MSLKFAARFLPLLAAAVLTSACNESTAPTDANPGSIHPTAMSAASLPLAGPSPAGPADSSGVFPPKRRPSRYAL